MAHRAEQTAADLDVDGAHRDLVSRAQDGDGSAWEVLYRRAYPKLLAYARARLDDEGAHDAVAETMSRAVAGVHGFRWAERAFDAWLFGILRHVITDAHRAQGRRRHVPEEAQGAGAGPLDVVVETEERAAVRTAFARLSDGDRELLELRVVAGLSADDVALVLDKRAGAVRMGQKRALARLRDLLEADGFDLGVAVGGAS